MHKKSNLKERINLRELTEKEAYKETYQDLEERRDLANQEQIRLEKKYNSKKAPNMKRLANYLRETFLMGKYELDKKEICKDLKILMGTLNIYLGELNRFNKFQPIRYIALKGKKDWIQVAGSNFDNDIDWIKHKKKEMTSRLTRISQTYEKISQKHEEEELKKFANAIKKKVKVKNAK